MSEKEIAEQAKKMWLEYHGDYPPDDVQWMPPVYTRGFRDALRWIQWRAVFEAAKGDE